MMDDVFDDVFWETNAKINTGSYSSNVRQAMRVNHEQARMNEHQEEERTSDGRKPPHHIYS
jgi:hypothetical protein